MSHSENQPVGMVSLTELVEFESAKSETEPSYLEEARLSQDRPLRAVLFQMDGVRILLHYDTKFHGDKGGFVRCLGGDCPYCKIGIVAREYLMIPVYDLMDKRVKVLRVSTTMGPQALAPQLAILGARQDLPTTMVSISRDGHRYKVNATPLPDDAENGAAEIADFLDRLEAGSIDLTECYPLLPEECLKSLPHISQELALLSPSISESSPALDLGL
jgi:hypothetical protein